jgi:hypothetical protein
VVAGRRGDHAAFALLGAQLRDEVDATAHLERADRLVVLVLDVDLGPEQVVERRVAVQRGGAEVRRDAAARLENVHEGRDGVLH